MWKIGTIYVYEYQVKCYEVGSQFGINGGRISKLFMRKDDEIVVSYDREWDIYPEAADLPAYEKLLAMYN